MTIVAADDVNVAVEGRRGRRQHQKERKWKSNVLTPRVKKKNSARKNARGATRPPLQLNSVRGALSGPFTLLRLHKYSTNRN
jgi:hypothetical protein